MFGHVKLLQINFLPTSEISPIHKMLSFYNNLRQKLVMEGGSWLYFDVDNIIWVRNIVFYIVQQNWRQNVFKH